MINLCVFDAALRLVCEIDGENINTDYRERSRFLLPLICQSFASLDKAYRQVNGLDEQDLGLLNAPEYPLQDDFPLSDCFLLPAAAQLASLLVISENSELSERLESLSERSAARIRKDLPFRSEAIVNKHP